MQRRRPSWPLLLALGGALLFVAAGCGGGSSPAVCGDGIVEGGEVCDDGTQAGTVASGACSATCEWQENNPDTSGTGSSMWPYIAMNAAGDYVVVWQASGSATGEGADVYAAVYGANGAMRIPAFRVNETITVEQVFPQVGIAGDGRFAVAWHTEDPYAGHLDIDNVSLRAFNADGTPASSEIQVNTWTTGRQARVALAVNEAGALVMAWGSDGQDGDLTGVFVQLGSVNGQLAASDPFQANTETSNTQENPHVGLAQTGNFVVAWESLGQESS